MGHLYNVNNTLNPEAGYSGDALIGTGAAAGSPLYTFSSGGSFSFNADAVEGSHSLYLIGRAYIYSTFGSFNTTPTGFNLDFYFKRPSTAIYPTVLLNNAYYDDYALCVFPDGSVGTAYGWGTANIGSADVAVSAFGGTKLLNAGSIPVNTWHRLSMRQISMGNPVDMIVRLFVGANKYGATPDFTLQDGALPGTGYSLVAGATVSSSEGLIDSIYAGPYSEGWYTRSGGGPPPAAQPKGWWITKPG